MQHKLTKEQAILLDDVLVYMEDANSIAKQTVRFNYDSYSAYKVMAQLPRVPMLSIKAAFSIADLYLTTNKPYSKDNETFWSTSLASPFLLNGGFSKIWEDENSQEAYTEQLRISTLQTNQSVIDTNEVLKTNSLQQTNISKMALVVSGLAVFVALLTFSYTAYKGYNDLNPKSTRRDTLLEQQVQLESSIGKSISRIDSSISKLDSSKKHPQHK